MRNKAAAAPTNILKIGRLMPRGPKGEKRPANTKRPKLTDAERHKRFVAMAREVEASEDPKDFERAFDRVTSAKPSDRKPPRQPRRS